MHLMMCPRNGTCATLATTTTTTTQHPRTRFASYVIKLVRRETERERDQINVADVYGRRVRVCREVVKPFDMDH